MLHQARIWGASQVWRCGPLELERQAGVEVVQDKLHVVRLGQRRTCLDGQEDGVGPGAQERQAEGASPNECSHLRCCLHLGLAPKHDGCPARVPTRDPLNTLSGVYVLKYHHHPTQAQRCVLG